MKVLVTGGCGFVGSYVTRAVRERGDAVRVLDRAGAAVPEGVELHTADLLTSDSLEQAFDGVEVLIHLAASMRGTPDEMVRNTVEGTRRVLDAMARTATRRLVLASSFSVYDWAKLGTHIDETSPVLDAQSAKPLGAYALAKTMQERLVRDAAAEHGWTLTVLRPAVIWGKGTWGDFLVGPRIGPLRLVFAPSAMIRLCYVENAADAFALAAHRTGEPRELVLNVIDDPQATTWQHARLVTQQLGGVRIPKPYGPVLAGAKVMAAITGGKGPYFTRPLMFEALHKPVTWSNQRLRDTLQWTPRCSYPEAVKRATT